MSSIKDVRARGIDSTIRIGTPGPAGIKRLLGFARRFGIGANAMIVKKYGFSLTNLMGSAGPDRFVTDLSALLVEDPATGNVLLHFYTFGGILATAEWARDFTADTHCESTSWRSTPTNDAITPASPCTAPTDRASLLRSRDLTRNEGNIVTPDQYSDNPQGGNSSSGSCSTVRTFPRRSQRSKRTSRRHSSHSGSSGALSDQSIPKRMAILASKSDHCLLELLWRHRRGELPVTIPMVISNHTDSAADVRAFGIQFFHVPSQGLDKSAAEARIVKLLAGNVDFVVLARYMQILSDDFLTTVGTPVINIHHSFLPAFIGAAPYRRAKERGVKLIGATSHYVTSDLDEGPIIEQDVARVTHAESATDLQARGAYVERAVLSRAVQWHAEDRIIRHGNHTVVLG